MRGQHRVPDIQIVRADRARKANTERAYALAEKFLLQYGDDREGAVEAARTWRDRRLSPTDEDRTRQIVIELIADYPTE